MKLWGNRLPAEDTHNLAYMLFYCDNPPGAQDISGARTPSAWSSPIWRALIVTAPGPITSSIYLMKAPCVL